MHLASYLVIDEADLMIDLGLIEDVDYIAARLKIMQMLRCLVLQFHNSYKLF